MNVYFIDTTVFCNMINLDKLNRNRKEVMEKLSELVSEGNNVLILPFATIVETGNHIAHCPDGNKRRLAAGNFCKCIDKMVNGEAPWIYYGEQFGIEDLRQIIKDFPDWATRSVGIGDVSIIQSYYKYKDNTPAINYICIWSLDEHLSGYREEILGKRNRK